MFKKKIVCVIPVKTKSTRLKKKNFLNFYGTPLFLLAIKIAKASKCFDLIIVTSDNKRIKRLCEKNGAIFHYRTKYTDKHSAVSLATYNVINELRLYKNFDYVAQLMATCPLRTVENIQGSILEFFKKKNNYQISVYNCSWVKNNYIFYNKNKNYKLFKNEFLTGKSCLFPSGVVWLAKIKKFMKEKTFYGKKYALHELPWYNSIDIDYEKDFLNAKIIKKFFKYPYV
jgi:CMP-N-acetylneuraminic acid synthetase